VVVVVVLAAVVLVVLAVVVVVVVVTGTVVVVVVVVVVTGTVVVVVVVVVVTPVVVVVLLVVVVVGVVPPNTACHWSANAWPFSPLIAATIADEASSSTRWLLPAGEGRPTTALTAPSSDPSPFGPHPVAPGTANVLSPCTAPLTTIVSSGPLGSGTPFGSKLSNLVFAPDRSVFSGFSRIGS
jgi:hypothetical protein